MHSDPAASAITAATARLSVGDVLLTHVAMVVPRVVGETAGAERPTGGPIESIGQKCLFKRTSLPGQNDGGTLP